MLSRSVSRRVAMGKFRTVIVEGNIASGKSLLLNELSKFKGISKYNEPVDRWRNLNGMNLLQAMYEKPKENSFAFQSFAQLTMHQQHQATPKPRTKVKLLERSLFSARHCFSENLHKNGSMRTMDYEVLKVQFQILVNTLAHQVDEIIYLKTRPEICLQRLAERNRSEENQVPLQYLEELHNLHESWISSQNPLSPAQRPLRIRVIDGNRPMRQVLDDLHSALIEWGCDEESVENDEEIDSEPPSKLRKGGSVDFPEAKAAPFHIISPFKNRVIP